MLESGWLSSIAAIPGEAAGACSHLQFTGEATSFPEVQYFTAELENYVQLYQALGGGW